MGIPGTRWDGMGWGSPMEEEGEIVGWRWDGDTVYSIPNRRCCVWVYPVYLCCSAVQWLACGCYRSPPVHLGSPAHPLPSVQLTGCQWCGYRRGCWHSVGGGCQPCTSEGGCHPVTDAGVGGHTHPHHVTRPHTPSPGRTLVVGVVVVVLGGLVCRPSRTGGTSRRWIRCAGVV